MKRTEYPRPQFVRRDWLCLNGIWDFAFDDEGLAASQHWELDSHGLDGRIEVPFCFESRLSGIQDTSIHGKSVMSAQKPAFPPMCQAQGTPFTYTVHS